MVRVLDRGSRKGWDTSTRGAHHASLCKPIQSQFDFRSDYISDINAGARRIAILVGFTLHCETVVSVLSSDNSDGQKKTGKHKYRTDTSEE